MEAYVSAELVRSQKHTKQNTDVKLEHDKQLFTVRGWQRSL